MPKKLNHDEIKKSILDGVIKAGAKFGLEGITNQAIAELSGQKETCIYRYFSDREDCIKKAFFSCDRNFFAVLKEKIPNLTDRTLPVDYRFYSYLSEVWEYSMLDLDYCRFYIRFYFANFHNKAVQTEHRKNAAPFFEMISPYLNMGDKQNFLMHQIFSSFLSAVMDVAMEIEEDSMTTRMNVFQFMYRVIEPYIVMKG